MLNFVASKFDPETDPDRPKVGDTVEDGRVIKEVGHLLMSQMLAGSKANAPEGYEILCREHPTRAVVWIICVEAKK